MTSKAWSAKWARARCTDCGSRWRQKQSPPNGYSAKFSTPYCIAVGFLDGKAGFEQFTDERVNDPTVRALAGKVSYVIDPGNPYPANFTGHIRATLSNGAGARDSAWTYARRRA